METAISKEEAKAYDRGIYATFLGAFLVLFQIGIYFVYIPWKCECSLIRFIGSIQRQRQRQMQRGEAEAEADATI